MEDIEKQNEEQKDPLFSKQDFDAYKKDLEAQFQAKEEEMKKQLEADAKKASMTETERIRMELDEIKQKYQEKENECQIAKEKEETISLLEDAGLGKDALELVFAPLNMELTRVKIDILKGYVEKIQQEIYETGDTPLPLTSNNTAYDPFLEGFDTNTL